jgi:excisionase family DNA binding protein
MGERMVDVLTIEEAAEELKVQPKTVREWLRTGRLEGIKAGRLWRIRREEWERFLAESTTKRKNLTDEDLDDIAAAEEALADPVRIPHEQVRRNLGL